MKMIKPSASWVIVTSLVMMLGLIGFYEAYMFYYPPSSHDQGAVEPTSKEIYASSSSKEKCHANTIIFGGLSACYRDSMCNLNDVEIMQWYLTGKEKVIECKRAELLENIFPLEEEPKEVPDDLFVVPYDRFLNPDNRGAHKT